jgi:hypothetical protein
VPFPKDFADSDRREIFRRMQTEKMTGPANLRQNSRI